MRRRSSKYGERTNVGTRAFGILFGIPLVGLFIILIPVFWAEIIALVLLIVGLNELVKHRRVKKDGTWEWCRERQPHNWFNFDAIPDPEHKMGRGDDEYDKEQIRKFHAREHEHQSNYKKSKR